MIDLGFAISLAPADAISYFQSKGFKIGWNWQDTWQEVNSKAFTVAKVVNAEVLDTIKTSVAEVLATGATERQFQKELTPVLKKQGWWGKKIVVDSEGNAEVVQEGSAHRLRTIYRTNLQTAFQAGRYKQQFENADARPWWTYVSILDGVARHDGMHMKTFRFDDPIWQYLYPPNGWGCRCRVRAMSDSKVQRLKITPLTSAGKLTTKKVDAGTNQKTGEVYQAEVTTFNDGKKSLSNEAGWNYNTGQAAFGTDQYAMRRLNQISDPAIKAQAISTLGL